MGIGKLIADALLSVECWVAKKAKLRAHRAEKAAKLDRARVRRGVLGILR